jgi:hypothetical protein
MQASPAAALPDDAPMTDVRLLQQTQQLIHVEKRLTALLRETEPWLPTAVAHPHRRRVRPIPTTMEQVEGILALGRKYAAQTSAPAGWNPAAPLVGFTTPAPLPNQLRAGCLAALQLERAQAHLKRQREQAVARQQAKEEAAKAEAAPSETANSTKSGDEPDPKRREVRHHEKQVQRQVARDAPPPEKAVVDSMNLSDSSDDDSDDD